MREYWYAEDNLRTHLADNLLKRGEIEFENHKSNEYCGMDYYIIRYREIKWRIIYVDGMACQIEKLD